MYQDAETAVAEQEKLRQKMKGMLDHADSESRGLTGDEEKTYAHAEIESQRIETWLSTPTTKGIRPDDDTGYRGIEVGRDMFADGGFRNFGEQLIACKNHAMNGGEMDKRQRAIVENNEREQRALGMSEGSGSEGGFLVQKDYSDEIYTNMHEAGEVLKRTRRVPLSANSNGLKFKAVDETSRVDGSRGGGVQAYWQNEATSATKSKLKFKIVNIDLHKLFAYYHATDELVQDAQALGALAQQQFTDELLFKAESAIISGNGSGQPTGILGANATVEVAKESSQAGDTIVTANLSKMWARLPARSQATAVWFINVDTQPELDNLFLAVQNVAGSENVGGLNPHIYSADKNTIKGRPVVPIEHCETLGDSGDIILADLSTYVLIDKGGVDAASSAHVAFDTDEMTYRYTWRLNGRPLWDAPLTPHKGSNSQSPYVKLAART